MIRRIPAVAAAVPAIVAMIVGVAPVAGAAPKMTITSPAFADGEPIPDGFTCDGANASPPLHFRHVPRGVNDLAIIVADPDASNGTFVHWVAWRLPKRGVPEEHVPASVVQGANGTGSQQYFGPCPPPGPAHHYVFTLYATSKRLDLAAGASAADVRAAVRGSTLARARLVGTYARA
jgi:Raf kinase inhibitor-like YbhB/YbcL family protein